MASQRSDGIDSQQVSDAVLAVYPWVKASEDAIADGVVERPPRADVAAACRLSAALLAQRAPGQSVEVRIPPFTAVQCVAGPVHRRGTPPNVVQCSARTWLRLAAGLDTLAEAITAGAEVSGAQAADIAAWLPVVDLAL